jgi:hypothetical protein
MDQILEHAFPESCSFVKNKSISVSKVSSLDTITEMFNLRLSQAVADPGSSQEGG